MRTLRCNALCLAVLLGPMVPSAVAQGAAALQQLAATQEAAVKSGDGAAILQSSRLLAEAATRVLAAIAESEQHPERTLELQRQMAFADLQPESAAAMVTAEILAGQRKEASEDAQAAIDAIGDSAHVRTVLAAAMHAGDDLNGTVAELQKAAELAPDAGMVHLALGEALWELNEQQYSAASLAELRKAEQLQPNDFATEYNLGVQLVQFHEFAEGATRLRHAARIDGASPDPMLQMGLAEYQQNQMEAARADLERAVQLTGADDGRNGFQLRLAYAALSRIYMAAGHDADATRALERAQELHARMLKSDQAPPLSQSTGMAVTTFVPRAGAAPGSGKAAPGIAPAASADLVATLQTVVARSANDAGTALARQQAYGPALAYFRWAAQADARFDPVQRNLGIAAVRSGLYSEAIDALHQALALHPDDALAARYLAEAEAAAHPAH